MACGVWTLMNRKKSLRFGIFVLLAVVISSGFVLAQNDNGAVATVCCERTVDDFTCVSVLPEECAAGAQQVPTSCESTAFCKEGYCYDPLGGTCPSSTPKLTCDESGGIWSETLPQQCELGCCRLGDQWSFTTQVRCNALSDDFGLALDFDANINDEISCSDSVAGQEKGACVFEKNFITTCEFTSNNECKNGIDGEFFAGRLCTDPDLGTNCLRTTQTMLVPGKEEIFFRDSCENPANIFDSSKVDDNTYWTIVFSKVNSCGSEDPEGNAGSTTCGNCAYLSGSIARETAGGGHQCVDIDCSTQNNVKLGGQSERSHGESWCVNKDVGANDGGVGAVGGRYSKYVCQNGEVVIENCDDLKAQVCVESEGELGGKVRSQASCRVNIWRDCTGQTNATGCEDTQLRDCIWRTATQGAGTFGPLANQTAGGACVPRYPPGFEFWDISTEDQAICNLGSAVCVTIWERGLTGKSKIKKNQHCLQSGWEQERAEICASLGDCGPKINWAGEEGASRGYTNVFRGGRAVYSKFGCLL